MRKLLTILSIAILASMVITSCASADPEAEPTPMVDAEGLTQNIRNLVPQSILDEMRSRGMPIYGGANPPDVTGTYYATPFDLIGSNIPGDNIVVNTNTITFKDLDKLALTLRMDYYVNFINPAGITETGDGVGSFIVGSDCRFSVFIDGRANIQGHEAKTIVVISGEFMDNGIANFHWANYMVDNRGNTTNFIQNGQGRVFRDRDGWSDRIDTTTPAPAWHQRMPDCPCTYEAAKELTQTQCPKGEWSDCGSANQEYHYGAAKEVRWYPAIVGQAGQQCTYDTSGRLITGGIAAGSPDKASPMSCGFWSWLVTLNATIPTFQNHKFNDMDPWESIPCWQYMAGWPSNNDNACNANVVSGITHMTTMIGNMTCEEATLLIRSAKEASLPAIDLSLRNFILGLPSTLTNAQVKALLQNWKNNSNICSGSPADPLCTVINKAIVNLS